MKTPEEYGKRIQKEIAKMYPNKWFEMYFSEQQKAIAKDRRHNYEHIILKIGDEYCDKLSLEYQRYLDKRIEQIERYKEIINKIHEEYQHQLAEKDKEIDGLKSQNNFLMETHTYRFEFPIFYHNGIQKEKLVSKVPIQDYVLKAIRHQVCEGLVERLGLKQMKKQFDINKVPVGELKINYNTFMKVLDQIEQGESK